MQKKSIIGCLRIFFLVFVVLSIYSCFWDAGAVVKKRDFWKYDKKENGKPFVINDSAGKPFVRNDLRLFDVPNKGPWSMAFAIAIGSDPKKDCSKDDALKIIKYVNEDFDEKKDNLIMLDGDCLAIARHLKKSIIIFNAKNTGNGNVKVFLSDGTTYSCNTKIGKDKKIYPDKCRHLLVKNNKECEEGKAIDGKNFEPVSKKIDAVIKKSDSIYLYEQRGEYYVGLWRDEDKKNDSTNKSNTANNPVIPDSKINSNNTKNDNKLSPRRKRFYRRFYKRKRFYKRNRGSARVNKKTNKRKGNRSKGKGKTNRRKGNRSKGKGNINKRKGNGSKGNKRPIREKVMDKIKRPVMEKVMDKVMDQNVIKDN